MLAVHTSPFAQPGTGDAGGLNVYVVQTARRLAERGIEVEIFTRATSSSLPPTAELAPGVLVRHVTAGPVRGPRQGRPARPAVRVRLGGDAHRGGPAGGLLRPDPLALLAQRAGRLAGGRPLAGAAGAHHAHHGPGEEPGARRGGRPRAVRSRDRRAAGRGGRRPPGREHPRGGRRAGRAVRRRPVADQRGAARRRPGAVQPRRHGRAGQRLGQALDVPPDAALLLFVGRIQPLKAPDVLLRAAARTAGASSPSCAAGWWSRSSAGRAVPGCASRRR